MSPFAPLLPHSGDHQLLSSTHCPPPCWKISSRRSAGVPFIVQAVVVGEDGDGTLRTTMARLLKLAKEGSSEARVHSLNILRALYRDSRLGDAVTFFLEGGVIVAITGFKAANWAERTAATLLFSALMTRIFGVKRD